MLVLVQSFLFAFRKYVFIDILFQLEMANYYLQLKKSSESVKRLRDCLDVLNKAKENINICMAAKSELNSEVEKLNQEKTETDRLNQDRAKIQQKVLFELYIGAISLLANFNSTDRSLEQPDKPTQTKQYEQQ